jgi:hypothetical protein
MKKACDSGGLLAAITNEIWYFNTITIYVMAATLYITFIEG